MRILIALLIIMLPSLAMSAPWVLDPAETSIKVKVGYKGSSAVTVDFPAVAGRIDFDEKRPQTARAVIKVGTRSAETGLGFINSLVKSPDYLASRAHPEITFQLDRLTKTSDSTADIAGRITLRGVTRPVVFKAQVFRFGPSKADPAVFEAGFDLNGQIDRRDFGSVAGQPDVATVLPISIRLVMHSQPT